MAALNDALALLDLFRHAFQIMIDYSTAIQASLVTFCATQAEYKRGVSETDSKLCIYDSVCSIKE